MGRSGLSYSSSVSVHPEVAFINLLRFGYILLWLTAAPGCLSEELSGSRCPLGLPCPAAGAGSGTAAWFLSTTCLRARGAEPGLGCLLCPSRTPAEASVLENPLAFALLPPTCHTLSVGKCFCFAYLLISERRKRTPSFPFPWERHLMRCLSDFSLGCVL